MFVSWKRKIPHYPVFKQILSIFVPWKRETPRSHAFKSPLNRHLNPTFSFVVFILLRWNSFSDFLKITRLVVLKFGKQYLPKRSIDKWRESRVTTVSLEQLVLKLLIVFSCENFDKIERNRDAGFRARYRISEFRVIDSTTLMFLLKVA